MKKKKQLEIKGTVKGKVFIDKNGNLRLKGFVYGHPEVPDGSLIRPSSKISKIVDGVLVYTKNSIYKIEQKEEK